MSKMINNFAGMNGFIWWMGVVENRMDPLGLGRCQVRIFGWHTDNLQLIPSSDLPWALPVLPSNNSGNFSTPKEGDYVTGFFADAEAGQFPIMLGVLPGIKTADPSGNTGFQDPRTPAQIAAAPRVPAAASTTTSTTANTQTVSAQTYIGQPTTPAIARGVFVGTVFEKAYNNRAHVCDITAETTLAIAKIKSVIMKAVKIIRDAIAALFAGAAALPIVTQITQAVRYIKQKIKLIQKELKPILDEIKAIQKYIKLVQQIIQFILSLPAKAAAALKACLANFTSALGQVTAAAKPLIAAATVLTNAQAIAQTTINTASTALTNQITSAANAVIPKLA